MDMKSTFLNGSLENEVFVKQLFGFIKHESKDKAYRLKKAQYNHKQAPQVWIRCINSFFHRIGFKKCPFEYVLYVKVDNSCDVLMLYLYVKI